MEPVDLKPDSVIDFLLRKREIERERDKDRENRYVIEQNEKLNELRCLKEQQTHSVETIKRNLKTLVAQKHALHKVVNRSEEDIPKLPVTHEHQQEAINFVSDVINFVNNYPEIQKSVQPENDVDTEKLCNQIRICGESVSKELRGSKTRVNQVGTLRENMDIIKNQCYHTCDDENGVID